jgi:hypothetical protein
VCEVLAHLRMTFHPRTYGLCGGAAAIAVALIGYGGMRLLLRRGRGGGDCDRLFPLHRRTFTLDRLLQHFFRYTTRLVVTIHDLLHANLSWVTW